MVEAIRCLTMEEEDDGSARIARLEKAKPTRQENSEFAVLMFALAFVLLCVFGMGILGSMMIFWRLLG